MGRHERKTKHMIFGYSVAQSRKFLVALAGALVLLLTSVSEEFTAYLDPQVSHWIVVGVGFLTALGVFLTKNAAIIDAVDGESSAESV